MSTCSPKTFTLTPIFNMMYVEPYRYCLFLIYSFCLVNLCIHVWVAFLFVFILCSSPFFLIFLISLNKLFLLSLAYFKLGTLWYPSFFYYMPNSNWVLCCRSFTFITCVLQGKVFFAIVLIISLPYLLQTQSFVVTPSSIAYKIKGIVR